MTMTKKRPRSELCDDHLTQPSRGRGHWKTLHNWRMRSSTTPAVVPRTSDDGLTENQETPIDVSPSNVNFSSNVAVTISVSPSFQFSILIRATTS